MSTINLSIPPTNPLPELRPRISVIGVGGAGGNAVNNMIRARLEGVEFLAANTDSQALAQSLADRRIQLGVTVTQGLGAGSRPDIGRIAAEEALEDIIEEFRGSNMVFIAAGMGGGTGTGAAPVIARAAREQGILTVGVVTKPFHFEGAHRMRLADQGIEELEQYVDTLIIIPNQNLFRVANERTTFADAFKMADDVLYSGVRGVTDLMVMPGLINLDFADIRAVMSEMGKAMMGTGEATGDRRALDAAEAAISNPLLDDVSMKGARGVLINITGGPDMTLFEVDEAANRIRSEVDSDAFIIFGSTFDDTMDGRIRVSVVATGMEVASAKQPVTKLNVTNINDIRQQARHRGAAGEGLHVPVAAEMTALPMEALREGTRDGVVEDAVASSPHPVSATIEDGKFMPPIPLSKSGDLAAAASSARPIESEAHKAKAGMMSSLFSGVFGNTRARPARGETEPTLEEAKTPSAKPAAAAPTGERPTTAQTEEEYFDIPAFLRRQAN